MIETIYSTEENKSSIGRTSFPLFRFPKNIRQVGQINQWKKIYIEDYVMTYIGQIAISDNNDYQVAVLLGQFIQQEDSKSIFISGAIKVNDISFEEEKVFSNEAWTQIYENMKEHFTDVEIVGWFLTRPGLVLEVTDRLNKIHIDNFAGQDKTLLLYDGIVREEAFFLYENGGLKKQEGYYVYYEKNEQMQNYMISQKKSKGIEESYEEDAAKKIRNLINEKKAKEESKKTTGLFYGVSTLISAVVLVSAVSLLSSNGKLAQMEQTVDQLTNIMKTDKTQEEQTEIETVSGNVTTIKEEKIVDEEERIEEAIKQEEKKKADSTQEPVPTEKNTKKSKEEKESTSQSEKTTKNKKSDVVETANKTTKQNNYYTVKKGDTLFSISIKKYNDINYADKIKELNNIENGDMIYIGQKLLLP